MSRYFRRGRKDASHAACVKAFEAHGCDVLVIDAGTKDAWDLEVGFLGADHGVEVKPVRAQVRRNAIDGTKLRPSQAAFHSRWRGARPNVVHSPEEVAALVKAWRQTAAIQSEAALALVEKRKANGQTVLMARVS